MAHDEIDNESTLQQIMDGDGSDAPDPGEAPEYDPKENNLYKYAQAELERAGLFGDNDFYGGMTGNAVMRLMEVHCAEGHSGMSNGHVLSLFQRLAGFNPISPLTGEDDEWQEVGERDGKTVYQSKRCSTIFKEGDRAYNIEGRVFREPNGACYTNRDSFVDVTFPYVVPYEPEVVDVPATNEPTNNDHEDDGA